VLLQYAASGQTPLRPDAGLARRRKSRRRVQLEFKSLRERGLIRLAPKDATQEAANSNTFWYLHPVLVDWIRSTFGEIEFEPYADTRSAKRTQPWIHYGFQDDKCKKLIDANALDIPWLQTASLIYTNHPWRRGRRSFNSDFSVKMQAELDLNIPNRVIVSLVPFSNANWYTDLYQHPNCVAEITIAKERFNKHTKFTVVDRNGAIKTTNGEPKGTRNGDIAFLVFAHLNSHQNFPDEALQKIRAFVDGLRSIYEKPGSSGKGKRKMVQLRFVKDE